MADAFIQLFLFSAKAIILVLLILFLLIGVLAIFSRGKTKIFNKVTVKHLNERFEETNQALLEEVLSKDAFKQWMKENKKARKEKEKKSNENMKNIYVLNFEGDIKASGVTALREEVTAILGIANICDEVVVRLESAGGMVHAYGLAAAQLLRIRERKIPLTIIVDKVAASGGYLMACVANKLYAAPFAIIGSIGVIVQLPNFHRYLKEKNIDFEQITAGNFKRTITLFGNNTEEGRKKLREEINEIHDLFKKVIADHRPHLDIQKVSTGEIWLGQQALDLNLIDQLKTSDDYLYDKSHSANIYEIQYQTKKSLAQKLATSASAFKHALTREFLAPSNKVF